MSELGLTPGMSGNVSVRSRRGHPGHAVRHAVRRAWRRRLRRARGPTAPCARDSSTPTTRVAAPSRHPRRAPRHRRDCPYALAVLHDDLVAAPADPRDRTTWSCSPAPTTSRAPSTPRSGARSSRSNAVASLRGGNACLLANHGMIALGRPARDRAAARRRGRDARRAVLARDLDRHAARARSRRAREGPGAVRRVRSAQAEDQAVVVSAWGDRSGTGRTPRAARAATVAADGLVSRPG